MPDNAQVATQALGSGPLPPRDALCPATARNAAASAIQALQASWFSWGNWSGTQWWHQANLLETLSNYAGYNHDGTYNSAIDPFFWRQDVFGLTFSKSYDDTQWVALSWLRADDIAPNRAYVDRGKFFYDYAASAWDDSKCGGGLWWSGAHDYKNAITNELFVVSSMKLYEKTHEQRYLDNAKRAWEWFARSGMINGDGLINDGLDNNTCANNGQTTWTYNQGVILGGLAMLGNATGDRAYVDRGEQIVDAVLRSSLVTQEGILREPCETWSQDCNQDQFLFKGIFLRYLGYLVDQSHRRNLVDKYRPFLATNVNALWNRARSNNTFDNRWTGPFRSADAQTQGSALDAFNTAVQLADASFCANSAIRGFGDKCLDLPAYATSDGTKVEYWTCNGGRNQAWTLTPQGQIMGLDGKCLDLPSYSTTNGTPIDYWTCNGGANQVWDLGPDGTIRGYGGKCLDLTAFQTGNGTQIEYWDCNGGSNQKWTITSQ